MFHRVRPSADLTTALTALALVALTAAGCSGAETSSRPAEVSVAQPPNANGSAAAAQPEASGAQRTTAAEQPGAAGAQPGANGTLQEGGAAPTVVGQPGPAGGQPGALQGQLIVTESGSSGAAAPAEPEACASEAHAATPDTIVFSILLDQSGSMTEDDDKWTPVSNAIRTFVTSPDSSDLGTMLQYFPLGEGDQKCEADTYEVPAVTLGTLPSNAPLIESSLDLHHFTQAEAHDEPHRFTPTRAAIEGTVLALQAQLALNPDSRGFLLLATDGRPSGCDDNRIQSVVAQIEQAAANGIKTYVIGIGNVGNLEDMAAAGATATAPFIVDGTGQNTEAQFLAALSSIQTAVVPCDFAVPEPAGGGIADLSKVNVSLSTVQAPNPIELAQVQDAQACDAAVSTWHYSDIRGETRVTLCAAVCEQLQRGSGATVSLATGCKTRTLVAR